MTGATTDEALTAALFKVLTMSIAPTHWLHPSVVWHVARASDRGALKAPPLTAAERAVAGLDRAPGTTPATGTATATGTGTAPVTGADGTGPTEEDPVGPADAVGQAR